MPLEDAGCGAVCVGDAVFVFGLFGVLRRVCVRCGVLGCVCAMRGAEMCVCGRRSRRRRIASSSA
eukprot:81772-Rhodomonas_salina.1